jgi:hypothetical protein
MHKNDSYTPDTVIMIRVAALDAFVNQLSLCYGLKNVHHGLHKASLSHALGAVLPTYGMCFLSDQPKNSTSDDKIWPHII